MTDLVPRATVIELEGHRTVAIERYAAAFDALAAASDAHGRATVRPYGPGFNFGTGTYRSEATFSAPKDRDKFLEAATKQVDRGMWNHLVMASGLERLMDRTERDAFRKQLADDPPPATAANVWATFQRLAGDAPMIFQRGLALAFAKLDRRFRSHDGFKIGSRIVFTRALDPLWGGWNHYARQDEALRDVERVFFVLDGQEQPERYAGIVGAIDEQRMASRNLKLQPFEAVSDYFRVKVYGNGNAHLWFKRDDLVEKANRVLAEYYGAALGAAPDAADVKHEPSRAMARNLGFFPTPPAVVARLLEEAGIHEPRAGRADAPLEVLEPSAGDGAIAKAIGNRGHRTTCIEIDAGRAAGLTAFGMRAVYTGDFFDFDRSRLRAFDRIVMNPPFDGGLDVDHVSHAMQFLAPGGLLVSVMSAGVEFREDKKTVAFRAMVERYGGRFFDLPAGSFSEVGTNVNTVLVRIPGPRADSIRCAA